MGGHDPDPAPANGPMDRSDRDLVAFVERRHERVDRLPELEHVGVHAVADVQELVDRSAHAPGGTVGPHKDHADVRATRRLLNTRPQISLENGMSIALRDLSSGRA